jgi:hypothetical protein
MCLSFGAIGEERSRGINGVDCSARAEQHPLVMIRADIEEPSMTEPRYVKATLIACAIVFAVPAVPDVVFLASHTRADDSEMWLPPFRRTISS